MSLRPSPHRLPELRLAPALLAAVALAPAAAAQGDTGFLRGEGHVDVVLAYTHDEYDEFWMGDDDVAMPDVGEVERVTYSLWAAYGWTDDLDLVVNAHYVESSSDGLAGAPDEEDLQDVVLAAKWRVWRRERAWGELSLLVAPGVKLPMSDYEDDAITALGDGQVDLRGRVIVHARTHGGLFASLETGYDRRNGAPDDEVPVHLTVGQTIGRVTVAPFVGHVESLGGTDIGDPGASFPSNEEDYTRAGVGLFARLTDEVGVTAAWRTTLDGRNTGDVEGYTLGLVFRAR